MKRVTNRTGSAKTYQGQEIADGASYDIPAASLRAWSEDAVLIGDLLAANGLVLSDGVSEYAGAAAVKQLSEFRTRDVVTQMEKDDKTLKTVCGFATSDAAGVAEFAIPIPAPGRWLAYGDMEFKVRHFGDYVSAIEVSDLKRNIARALALAMDPEATEPLADAVVQALPGEYFPDGKPKPYYPVLGNYQEKELPNPLPAEAKGSPRGGMAMTFQFGQTEAQPVGGYAYIPEDFFLVVRAQKLPTARLTEQSVDASGFECQLSIDWAVPDV